MLFVLYWEKMNFQEEGIIEEDFYSVFCESQKKSSESFFISGVFSNLTEAQKVEYLSWLDKDSDAKLNFEVQQTLNRRNNYNKKMGWQFFKFFL